jgi:predicted RNase H-like HicB family nuclease
MKVNFEVLIECDSQGYFVASVPVLPGCHTQARTLDKLQSRIEEAIALCLEEYGDQFSPSEFVGILRVAVDA